DKRQRRHRDIVHIGEHRPPVVGKDRHAAPISGNRQGTKHHSIKTNAPPGAGRQSYRAPVALR
ncbi:MAG TPA: hypothetical protein VNV18_06360, partial [Stellaceae bacterium]|nr:hypothetical protein [Stellaceae bacterium]